MNAPIVFSICGFGNPDHAEPPPITAKQLREAVKQIKAELRRRPQWNKPNKKQP